jgi:hypothetical protein
VPSRFKALTTMPDGPRYEDDFYAWTQYQAEMLRSLRTDDDRFDREHLADEVAGLGKSERDAVRSQVRRILEHFLKLAYSPAVEPRLDRMVSIIAVRATLDDKLSPTLRHDIEQMLPKQRSVAHRQAVAALGRYGETDAVDRLPSICPYTLDQILADDWYPEPAKETK